MKNKTGNNADIIKDKFLSAFLLAPLPATMPFFIFFIFITIANGDQLSNYLLPRAMIYFLYVMIPLVKSIILITLTYAGMLISWFFWYVFFKKTEFYRLSLYIYFSFVTGFIAAILISIYIFEPDTKIHFIYILSISIAYTLLVFITFWYKVAYKPDREYSFFGLCLDLLFRR